MTHITPCLWTEHLDLKEEEYKENKEKYIMTNELTVLINYNRQDN